MFRYSVRCDYVCMPHCIGPLNRCINLRSNSLKIHDLFLCVKIVITYTYFCMIRISFVYWTKEITTILPVPLH